MSPKCSHEINSRSEFQVLLRLEYRSAQDISKNPAADGRAYRATPVPSQKGNRAAHCSTGGQTPPVWRLAWLWVDSRRTCEAESPSSTCGANTHFVKRVRLNPPPYPPVIHPHRSVRHSTPLIRDTVIRWLRNDFLRTTSAIGQERTSPLPPDYP